MSQVFYIAVKHSFFMVYIS